MSKVVCKMFGHKFRHENMMSNGNNFCIRCHATLWELTS
jgi:hypothetical protein